MGLPLTVRELILLNLVRLVDTIRLESFLEENRLDGSRFEENRFDGSRLEENRLEGRRFEECRRFEGRPPLRPLDETRLLSLLDERRRTPIPLAAAAKLRRFESSLADLVVLQLFMLRNLLPCLLRLLPSLELRS